LDIRSPNGKIAFYCVWSDITAFFGRDRVSALLRQTEPGALRVVTFPPITPEPEMHLTAAHVAPLVALIAGILILIVPRLLNYIVAIYLIIAGIAGLNNIHHFIR
jgi:uncharacterized membrane protein YdbT with pleckstrin-like domain